MAKTKDLEAMEKEKEYKNIFSKQLRYYMLINDKSQLDLAKELGVSTSAISDWCTGKSIARMGKVQALADYFGIKISDLITDTISPSSEADIKKDNLFKKRKLLFDMSEKASEEDLDKIIKIVDTLVGDEHE